MVFRIGGCRVAALGACVAVAADLPTRKEAPAPVYIAPFSWTGFYIGGNVGVVWGSSSVDVTGSPGYFDYASQAPGLLPYGLNGNNQEGLIGGGQAGYNYQFGSFVGGIETDFDGANLSRSRSYSGFYSPDTVLTSYNSELRWLGTTRLRLGFTPVEKALVYATGGVAYGGGSASGGLVDTYNDGTDPINTYRWGGSTNYTRVGWTIGGGAELAVTNNVLIRAEYLYYNLGSTDVTAYEFGYQSNPVYLQTKENINGSVARIGVDYKF